MKTSKIESGAVGTTGINQEKPAMSRLTADIERELHQQLKGLLAGRGETIQEWVAHQARMEVARPRLERLIGEAMHAEADRPRLRKLLKSKMAKAKGPSTKRKRGALRRARPTKRNK